MPTRRTSTTPRRTAAAAQRPAFVRSLLLPRAFAARFGLRDDKLMALLAEADATRDTAGVSGCARLLAALPGGATQAAALARWDAAVGTHEAAIGRARAAHALAQGQPLPAFRLTHFQWLAAVVAEWHLEALVADAAGHVAALEDSRARELPHLPAYTAAQARKLACFMATGAGKTLVMHLNLRQFLAHRLFEPQSILLLTPSEALSAQHRTELEASGLGDCGVGVSEITKFYVDATGARRPKKGVSEATSRYEGPNLLLVDEGHKGGSTGADSERQWRAIREALAAGATEDQAGFTFEYSATFAQIADRDATLYDEYAGAITVDFGYARFWRERYGKQPHIVNARADAGAEFALAAGLLAFYQQRLAFDSARALAAEYRVAPPLMACVGKDVSTGDDADVVQLVRFLARACADTAWLAQRVDDVLRGSVPVQPEFGLPPLDLRWLQGRMAALGWTATGIAADLAQRVFGGAGAVSLHAVGERELGLRSAGAATDAYFGVVRVGEPRKLADLLVRSAGVAAGPPDRVSGSLFGRLDDDPRLAVLIGAKMFIEGWSSWRVSALGLMNVGRSPGAEIIQLFGRGVRLQGRDFSLKRDEDAPLVVQALQSLQVFGVRSDYLQQFVETLGREGVKPAVLHVPVTVSPHLTTAGLNTLDHDGARFADVVPFDPPQVMPWRAQIEQGLTASVGLGPASALGAPPVLTASLAGWLDPEVAYQHGLAVKRRAGLTGLVFGTTQLLDYLGRCSAMAPAGWFDNHECGPARRAAVGLRALEEGLRRAWRQAERRFRMRRLVPVPLGADNAGLPGTPERDGSGGPARWAWRLEVDLARDVRTGLLAWLDEQVALGIAPPALRDDVAAVVAQHGFDLEAMVTSLTAITESAEALATDTLAPPLPRLHMPAHLFAPLLVKPALKPSVIPPSAQEQLPLFGGEAWADNTAIAISPPALNEGEAAFIWNLRAEWQKLHALPEWAGVHLYVLRNPAAGGLTLYREHGFAPDFMVWLVRGAAQVLGLVDPKGLARQWPADKLALIAELETATLALPVRAALLTSTLPEAIAWPESGLADAEALWRHRVLLTSDGLHISRLLTHLRGALPTASGISP